MSKSCEELELLVLLVVAELLPELLELLVVEPLVFEPVVAVGLLPELPEVLDAPPLNKLPSIRSWFCSAAAYLT